MPFPTISGVLNNCPLHVLTPELRQEIQSLADELHDLSPEMKDNYEILKTEFALFYDIDPRSFSWQSFSGRLRHHNGFDLQLILGPVLRKFMARMMENNLYVDIFQAGDEHYADKTIEEFIAYKTEVQDADGRYASLSPDEMFRFAAVPLGLRVAYTHDGKRHEFSEPIVDTRQRNRPLVEMFHQGGVEGAGAGGHFERTENVSERIDYEKDPQGSHLRVVAGLFRNDTPAITAIGLRLLCIYMHIDAQPKRDRKEMTPTFHLTVAQIEKYLYNRLYVDSKTAKLLLGDLTDEADELLKTLPELSIDSDAGVLTLIQHHHPSFRQHYNRPLKAKLSEQQYQVALTMLTPAVSQTQAHSYSTSTQTSSRTWPLRGNEIAALQTVTNEYVQHILYDQGLSLQLYTVCNKPEIARELSPDFLDLLEQDPNFTNRALTDLQNEVAARRAPPNHREPGQVRSSSGVSSAVQFQAPYSSPTRRGESTYYEPKTPNTNSTLNFHDIFSGNGSPEEGVVPYNLLVNQRQSYDNRRTARRLTPEFLNGDSSSSDEEGQYISQIGRPVAKKLFTDNTSEQPVKSLFWLRAMQACFAIGGLCAIVALLTCPPVATSLGLSTVLGVTVSDITVTATFVATSSALLAASFFAMHRTMDDPVEASQLRLRR